MSESVFERVNREHPEREYLYATITADKSERKAVNSAFHFHSVKEINGQQLQFGTFVKQSDIPEFERRLSEINKVASVEPKMYTLWETMDSAVPK